MKTDIIDFFEKSLDVSKSYLSTLLEESSEIEFKKSLHIKTDSVDKQYLKTIAGFANNSGVGISAKLITNFAFMLTSCFASKLTDCFGPSCTC